MRLIVGEQAVPLLVETGAFEGVRRIGGKVAEDIRKVTGHKPQVLRKSGPARGRPGQFCVPLWEKAYWRKHWRRPDWWTCPR